MNLQVSRKARHILALACGVSLDNVDEDHGLDGADPGRILGLAVVQGRAANNELLVLSECEKAQQLYWQESGLEKSQLWLFRVINVYAFRADECYPANSFITR